MQPYADLKGAIRTYALVTASSGAKIIRTEGGTSDEWIFDFRALMLQPAWLDRYAEIFWEQYESKYPFQVGGMESAAISLVSAIVMKGVQRKTPVNGFYIRKSRKRQGLMRQIEGTLDDTPIILVDDLINSGSTFEKQLAVLADTKKKVTDIFALLAFRSPDEYTALTEKGISLHYLFTLQEFGIPLQKNVTAKTRTQFETVWRYVGPDPSFHIVVQKSAPVCGENLVYLGCDDGMMRAIDKRTGSLVWSFSVGSHPEGKGILSTPVLYRGMLYFGAYDGVVYALDAYTGAERWRYDDADWVGSSPAIAPELGVVFVGLEFGLWGKRGGIVALDAKTGARRWQQKTPSLTHGSPLYIPEEQMVVIGSNDGVCYAYNARIGEILWRYQTGGDIKTSPAYDPKRKLVFVASMDAKLYALSARTGEPLFAYETSGPIYSIPLVQQDLVYVASLDKSLYAIDVDTGKRRWRFETNGRIFGSPVVHAESVFIGSNDGKLYELDAASGTLVGHFQASERIMSKVAYDDKTKCFFARTVANELYCLKHEKHTS